MKKILIISLLLTSIVFVSSCMKSSKSCKKSQKKVKSLRKSGALKM